MHPTVKAIRAHLQHIEGAWVRRFRDGQIWCGSLQHSTRSMREVVRALEAAGYVCECNGEKGTSGEYVVEVKLPIISTTDA